jgi:phosphohistidine phosphatase
MVLSIPTEVYFIRHGIAAQRGTYLNDDERPLVAKGVHKTQQVAARLHDLGLRFDTMLASPLLRSPQTASILQAAGLTAEVEAFEALAPDGPLETWLNWLAPWQQAGHQRLALIGHEPDLSQWAQTLVHGQIQNRWVLKKAGIIGLSLPEANDAIGNSQIFALIPPRFLI